MLQIVFPVVFYLKLHPLNPSGADLSDNDMHEEGGVEGRGGSNTERLLRSIAPSFQGDAEGDAEGEGEGEGKGGSRAGAICVRAGLWAVILLGALGLVFGVYGFVQEVLGDQQHGGAGGGGNASNATNTTPMRVGVFR